MKDSAVRMAFIALLFTSFIQNTLAFDVEHEAHVHGHASLTLVQEKDELQLVFKSPAINIVGFEHQAGNKEQHAKLSEASKTLADTTKLFTLNAQAQCTLEHAHVASALLEPKHDDHHDEERHEHEHEHEHEHGHGDAETENHSEFEAEYYFKCENIKALSEVKVLLFEVFTSLEEVEAQIIAKGKQRLVELDHDNVSINF